MPKVIIRETDNTSAGVGLYTNFTVVVPGFVRARAKDNEKDEYGYYRWGGLEYSKIKNAPEVFDENGIYECSSQKDFLNCIGRDNGEIITKAAVPAETFDGTSEIDLVKNWFDTEAEGIEWSQAHENHWYYVLEPDSDSEDDIDTVLNQKISCLKRQLSEQYKAKKDRTTYKNTIFSKVSETAEDGGLYRDDSHHLYTPLEMTLNPDYDSSKPLDAEYVTEVLEFDFWKPEVGKVEAYAQSQTQPPVDTRTPFAFLADDEIGKDAEKGTHRGNQIAYELLGLGYTVLYKKLDKDNVDALAGNAFWDALKDKSIYDFRYILSGYDAAPTEVMQAIINLANFINKKAGDDDNGRGDCTALLDVPSDRYDCSQSEAIARMSSWINLAPESKYAAYFAPYVEYSLATNDSVDKGYAQSIFPASFHYLACAAKASENFAEWYSVAGYTRGVCSYQIKGIGCKFGERAADALQPRHITGKVNKAINLITTVRGNHYVWGNRTAALLGEANTENGNLKASHFLNIRQLCSTIKKQVYITCRKYTYDPNSDILWGRFCADIRPLLEKMKGDQGIDDYRIIKVKTSQKAMFKAKIRIVPVYAVEDFNIGLTLEDSVAGVITTIEEE